MASHLLLQLLQEGEVRGLPRTQTLLVLVHIAGIKHDHCAIPPILGLVLHYCVMCGFCRSIHQYRDDPSVLLLHQVADDLVVEIWHRFPLEMRKSKKKEC